MWSSRTSHPYKRAKPIWPLTAVAAAGTASYVPLMAGERIWAAGLIIIGDEILSGRTPEKNVAQVAGWLNLQGIRLSEVRIVPDIPERIIEAVNAFRTTNDYLFTTGG